ncbi:MAG: imidazole glycerol phosphate synthase subunit HisH [Pseudomonadota bacterium]
MTETIAVIDYGMGNLRSVEKALAHVAPRHRVVVTADAATIKSADRVVFPGQGAARDCMKNLKRADLYPVVADAFSNKPFLGICMGLQVLFDHSDENGGVECLGLVPGKVVGFKRDQSRADMKIPHMGWNQVNHAGQHPLWANIKNGAHFYFVHSYYVAPSDRDWCEGNTAYLASFTSVIARDNVFATQCHPEKSADDGLQLLANFVQWKPA